jgi:hypothetical protein
MKKVFLCLVLLGSILTFPQCKKSKSDPPKQTTITYPAAGLYGTNLLNMQGDITIDPSLEFSLAANLQSDATLRIVFTNLDIAPNGLWWYDSASIKNWDITNYDPATKQQTYTSAKAGSLDLVIGFTGSGKCRLDFYENSSQSVTKSVLITWS